MRNKIVYIFLGLALVVIAVIVFIQIQPSNPASKTLPAQQVIKTKLQQCPDEWIDNQEPPIDPKGSVTQYFILNGTRRELSEFDTEWIQKNCNLKKQVVF